MTALAQNQDITSMQRPLSLPTAPTAPTHKETVGAPTAVQQQAAVAAFGNYMLAVMQAVSESIATGQNQQLSDADMATQDSKIEETMYNYYQKVLSDSPPSANSPVGTHLGYYVMEYLNDLANDPKSKKLQDELNEAQQQYQNAQTTQQAATNGADSATQTAQTQTGQDSSLMQLKVQLETAITQISQALSSALAG